MPKEKLKSESKDEICLISKFNIYDIILESINLLGVARSSCLKVRHLPLI